MNEDTKDKLIEMLVWAWKQGYRNAGETLLATNEHIDDDALRNNFLEVVNKMDGSEEADD